jgi:hypothetical protein
VQIRRRAVVVGHADVGFVDRFDEPHRLLRADEVIPAEGGRIQRAPLPNPDKRLRMDQRLDAVLPQLEAVLPPVEHLHVRPTGVVYRPRWTRDHRRNVTLDVHLPERRA